MTVDVSATCAPKSDQLNFDDLIMGPMTVRITKVSGTSDRDQPIAINFEGDSGKPYKPCKSMRRVMVYIWGRDGAAYVGKSLTLFGDPKVRFGGVDVGGIRISHMSDIASDITMALTASKTSRKPYTVKPLKTEPNEPTDPAVKAAGDAAAAGGVESYKAWLATLTPEVKKTVAWLHKEWSRVAKAVVIPDSDEIEFSDDGPVIELRATIAELGISLKNAGDSIDFTDAAKLDEWCEQEFEAKYADLNEAQLQTLRDELQDRLDTHEK
jgi:hypothetical protein